jgi:hypothetical protein
VSLAKLEGNVSPHALRHTAATWLMQIGVNTWEAAGFLGMSEKTLRDVYGHHHPDYLRAAASAIGTKKPVSLAISLVKKPERRWELLNLLKTLVADAVAFERVSTPKFPANREINRVFGRARLLSPILKADTRANSEACSEIIYATEQGIISVEQGILALQQGISRAKADRCSICNRLLSSPS